MKNLKSQLLVLLLSLGCLLGSAYAQLTPSADSYTNTAAPTTNFGAKTLLDVESASQTAYIRFDLSSIPADYSSANITKATLKLYVNSVTTAGSFNVDYVNGTWAENTITADLAPALGSTIAASAPLTTADKNQYVLIDVTTAVQAWLSGTTNDGVALVGNSPVNATFDSKESTSTSHAAELDIVFAGGAGGGGIAGNHYSNRQRANRGRNQRYAQPVAHSHLRRETDAAVERQRLGLRFPDRFGHGDQRGQRGGVDRRSGHRLRHVEHCDGRG